MNKLFSVFIKPTMGCNLGCSYCYHNHNDVNKRFEKMTLETIEQIYKKLENYETVKIAWHGGEPLMMGVDWFRDAVELQKKYKMKFINNMQSNITLLDQEWISFFKENKFGVGTSLDGVKELHDQMRNNSFNKVVPGIIALKNEGVDVAAITVITPESLPYLFDSFKLFQQLNLNIRINPAIKCSGSNKVTETNSKVYEFAGKFLWDLWLGSDKSMELRPMNYMYNYVQTLKKQSLFGNNCAGGANVLPDGAAYICSKFLGNDIGYIGNVNSPDFCFGLKNPHSLKYYKMNSERIKKCVECTYFEVCRGGCFYNGLMNENKEDIFCEAYKQIFRHVVIRAQQVRCVP